MAIKVAAAPVSWGISEVKGIGGQKSYSEVLDEMAQAGYEGTELGPYGYLPTEPERLTAELSARRLQLISAFVPIPLAYSSRHEAGFQEAMRVADLLTQSAARTIVLADEMNPARMAAAAETTDQRAGMTDRQWEEAVKFLHRTARVCRDRGLRVAFHHHAGTFVEAPAEIERICALTDPDLIGLCLDTGHYLYGGGSPVDAVRKYGARIWHLHLKDVQPSVLESVKRERVGFFDAVRRGLFCELGEGAVDFPEVIRSLSASGYNGWAVVEQDVDAQQPSVQPLQSAIRSRAYLRKVIQI